MNAASRKTYPQDYLRKTIDGPGYGKRSIRKVQCEVDGYTCLRILRTLVILVADGEGTYFSRIIFRRSSVVERLAVNEFASLVYLTMHAR